MPDPSTRRIPWPRIFAEGVVIVASILLALAADAWWEARQDLNEEQEILRGLESDFVANITELETVAAAHEGFHTLLLELEELSPSELGALSEDSVKTYVRALTSGRSFDARDATLQGILASGNLSLIRDARLREMLVAWRTEVEDASEETDDLRGAADRVLQRMAALGGPWDGGGLPNQTPQLAAALSSYPPANLMVAASDPELMNLARAKRFRATLYLGELLPLAAYADSVLSLVREAQP